MCFSPEADLTTGVVVAVVGIDALRHVSRPWVTPQGVGRAVPTIDGHHIAYTAGVTYAVLLTVLYVVATCGSLLAASDRLLAAFGLADLAVVGVINWLTPRPSFGGGGTQRRHRLAHVKR